MPPIFTPIRINAGTQNQLSLRCQWLYATLFAGWWMKQGHMGGQFWNWAKIMWRISDPNSATDSYSGQEKAELPLIHTQQQHIMMIFGWYGWYLEYRKDKWVIFGLQDIRQRKNRAELIVEASSISKNATSDQSRLDSTLGRINFYAIRDCPWMPTNGFLLFTWGRRRKFCPKVNCHVTGS